MASPAMAPQPYEVIEEQPSSILAESRDEFKAEIARATTFLNSRDEDGEPYYSKVTLDRGIAFLKMHIDGLWRYSGIIAPVPTIGPGPKASLDLYWKTASFELLVNIPASPHELSSFYGRDESQQTTRGS